MQELLSARKKRSLSDVLYEFLKAKGGCADYEEVVARLRQYGASESTVRKKLSQIAQKINAYIISLPDKSKRVCLVKPSSLHLTNTNVEVSVETQQTLGLLLRGIVNVINDYLTPYSLTIKDCEGNKLIVEAIGLSGRQIVIYNFTFEVDGSICSLLTNIFEEEGEENEATTKVS